MLKISFKFMQIFSKISSIAQSKTKKLGYEI